MTEQNGGATGPTGPTGPAGSYPGVTGDGNTPGGLVVAGALTAGDLSAASVPSYNVLYGTTQVFDSPANSVDGDPVLQVQQALANGGVQGISALQVGRSGDISVNDYTAATALIQDTTASTQPVMQVKKQNVTQFQVDGDGVQVHGKFKTGASIAHVCTVLSGNAVPIYDESGTLLGYAPLYN